MIDARAAHPIESHLILYDPDFMPSYLRHAHHSLHKAIEEAYDTDFDGNEEKIVAHPFKLYAEAAME